MAKLFYYLVDTYGRAKTMGLLGQVCDRVDLSTDHRCKC